MGILAVLDFVPFSTQCLVGLVVVAMVTWVYLGCRRPSGMPPGPPCLPVVGSIPFMDMSNEYIHDFQRLHKKYGKIFSMKSGNVWQVVVGDFELLKELFVRKGQDVAGRPFEDHYIRFNIMNPEKGFGILFGDYTEQWKQQRHVSMTILRNLGYGRNRLQEVISEEVEVLCGILGDKEGKVVDMSEILNVSISNVICTLLFGERYEHTDAGFLRMRKCVEDAFEMLDQDYEVDFLTFLRFLPYYKKKLKKLGEVYGHLNNEIRKRIRARTIQAEPGAEPNDFIEGYLRALKENKGLEDKSFQITQDFFQAGMETTTTTLGWAFYYMLRHPEIQARVHEELDRVVGQGRGVTLKDRENLPYTEACVAEVLRISCTVPLTVDHKALVDTHIAGYTIPKGTIVYGNLWTILRNPEVFSDPDEFHPDRFIQDDGSFLRHEHVINFSVGRRSCMGEQLARQEMFLFFTRILQKYRLSTPEGDTLPPPKGVFASTYRSPVYRVVAEPRH